MSDKKMSITRPNNPDADGSYAVFLADEQATEAFGAQLAKATQQFSETRGNSTLTTTGGRIFLSGELGAGKTTLVRGFMRAYGHAGAVKSPTYTLVEPYEYPDYNIYHFDLYRLSDPEEVEFLGVGDYFDAHNLCLIEWPEKGRGFLPQADLQLHLEMEKAGRRVNWQAFTEAGMKIGQRLIELLSDPDRARRDVPAAEQ